MLGWLSRARTRPSRFKALRKAGRGREGLWQHFEGDDAIELGLPCFEHRAHAAVADEAEDFEIGKSRGDLRLRGQIGSLERQRVRIAIGRHGRGGHEADGIETVEGISG